MKTSLTALAFLAAFGASTAWAQSSNDAAETENTEDGASIADELSLGEDAENVPAVGEAYAREIIGAWELRCIRNDTDDRATDPCQMYQLIKDEQDVPVAEVSIFRLGDSQRAEAGATIVVPLETALAQQLTVNVDGKNARRYPYSFCNPVGCYARVGLTTDDINQFKRGNVANITIVPIQALDQKITLPLSLSGFTATYSKTSVVEQ